MADFLTGHRAEIEAIEAHVLGSDTISWACDIQKGANSPAAPLLGHRHLTSVLLVHALETARAGNNQAAQRALEASWKLNLVLRERPELIAQLVATAIAGSHNAVLRRIPGTPAEWQGRLSSQDWRRSMLRSFQAEAWMFEACRRSSRPIRTQAAAGVRGASVAALLCPGPWAGGGSS